LSLPAFDTPVYSLNWVGYIGIWIIRRALLFADVCIIIKAENYDMFKPMCMPLSGGILKPAYEIDYKVEREGCHGIVHQGNRKTCWCI
jgi:hypothetical protein